MRLISIRGAQKLVGEVDGGERHRLHRVVVSRFRRRHGTLSVTDRECAANQRGHTDEPPESFRHGPMIPPERRRWWARGVTTARSGDKSLVLMNRRDFLKHSSAALALSAFPGYAFAQTSTPKRVGLIGSGWYGKMRSVPIDAGALRSRSSRFATSTRGCSRTPQRRSRRARPRRRRRALSATTARCSPQKDLDIVLIATPDHWHALPMIEAVKAGADIYVQKPISVDVAEGQAMLAAARKYKRVVQVGMQRRSTPHLVDARDRIIREGKLGKIALRRDLLLLPHARAGESAGHGAARVSSITRCGPAPRRCGPTTSWCIRAAGARSWNTATASSATCACTCSTWCAGCSIWAWPTRVSSTGGILVDKASKANITDTQDGDVRLRDLKVVWTHRSVGRPARSEVPVGRDDLWRQRDAQGQRLRLRFHPRRRRDADARGCAPTSSSSIPRTRPKRISRSTWRRRSART